MERITVRHLTFDFPAGMDPMIIEGAPEESYANVALSLLLPYLEPYLIRTMREARPHIKDAALADDLAKFNAQEGQHYRQHRRFNEALRTAGFPELRRFEDAIDEDYRRYTRTRSLRFNLAYAEGFEALTSAVACFSLEQGQIDRMQPAARDLFLWHLIEELEHRAVAFDVYQHVCGSYLYRLFVGLFAQWHLMSFLARVSRYMLEADPRALAEHGGKAGRRSRERRLRGLFLRHLLPKILATYSPFYTPRNLGLPARAVALAQHYTERATPSPPG